MEGAPDYVPRAWWRGRLNRRFAASPARVLAWLVLVPLVAIALAVWGLAGGGPVAVGIAGAIGAVTVGGQALTYAPRAWRASRQGARESR